MGIFDGGESLVSASKLIFLEFVGGARADHGNDSDKTVDIGGATKTIESSHGGALHVVDSACAPVGDHLPDGVIIPRGESFEIESGWAKGGSLASEGAGGEWLG